MQKKRKLTKKLNIELGAIRVHITVQPLPKAAYPPSRFNALAAASTFVYGCAVAWLAWYRVSVTSNGMTNVTQTTWKCRRHCFSACQHKPSKALSQEDAAGVKKGGEAPELRRDGKAPHLAHAVGR